MTYYAPVFIILVFIILLIVRPITALLHELGHAIPALLFSDGKVTLFIGSYGDKNKSIKISIGRLVIFFKYNPFFWNTGLCIPTGVISIHKNIIITAAGPFFSLTTSFLACFLVFYMDIHASIKLLSVFLFISGMIDFFQNITPSSTSITLHNGSTTFNDGYQIQQLRKFPKLFTKAINFYNETNYTEAAKLFEHIISQGYKGEHLYKYALNSYLQIKEYSKAQHFNEMLKKEYQFDSDDYANAGLIYSHLNNYEEALKNYSNSLDINSTNYYALNNRGYTLNLLGRYEDAITDFNLAVEINPEHAYSYNNRGLSKIMLGNHEEGLKDIKQSLLLDPDNSYCFRNLGIYFYEMGDFNKALHHLLKAKELDNNTHLVDYYINFVETKLL